MCVCATCGGFGDDCWCSPAPRCNGCSATLDNGVCTDARAMILYRTIGYLSGRRWHAQRMQEALAVTTACISATRIF